MFTGLPNRKDPRLLVISFFAVLIVYALNAPGFARTWQHLLLSITVCVLSDVVFSWLRSRTIIFPMSALVTSIGVFLLTDSPLLIATGAVAFLSILSKHLIRVHGRHIFNPNNFGLVACVWAFPDWIISGAQRWAGNGTLAAILLVIGTGVVYRARRMVACYSYVIFFLLMNVLRAYYFGVPLWSYSLSLTGPGMMLFIFFMISDPRTSPTSVRGQMIYGFVLALIDNYLRMNAQREAPFYTLFIVCATLNLYRAYVGEAAPFQWRTENATTPVPTDVAFESAPRAAGGSGS